ncbi:General secretion pathway protein A [Alteripontixanthobacter maritimus]|uniref:General secretion pathway protein A n=1 Tax=Alteripontixanthobacter maritimus TaxID=2161824 RepID=A0A369QCS1_9SPHN|nr:XrtA/PEP-CTERM system-associated ATPase [Alteripontixanthobacter maritimus]RDC60078.1 General secretion pathway protein A [Alteripontixanthobacter maritimus]
MFDDFYGLTGRPFQLTPDPQFYFESSTHKKALSYLGYGLAQGEGFIVITGEVGAGKSTLVAHLVNKIDPEQMTVAQIVTSRLDGEEMVHIAAQSFGLDIEGHDKASALGAIEDFLHEEARAGRRCLMVVDESQNLSVDALEELRMLSNFQLGSHPLLQVLLLGQPEFRATLAEHKDLEQLRQRVIASHHLAAMESAELEPYVRHRLECVGWEGNPAFDQRVFADMYEATSGIPRKVNQVATRLLLLGAVEQRSRIDGAMLASVLKEMQGDSAFPKATAAPVEEPAQIATVPFAAPKPASEPELAQEAPQSAVFQGEQDDRDDRIAELEQAIEALQASDASMSTRYSELEQQMADQDRAVRDVLTMLIEYVEGETARKAA